MVLAPRTSSLPKLLLKPGRWTVGSAATCSYRIAADGVRPRHALVVCGGKVVVLKAWDECTWHNGQPVRGEVRLQPGDHVVIGSVEFSVEPSDAIDAVAALPDAARANCQHDAPASGCDLGSSDHSLARRASFETASSGTSDPQPEGWDLERLRDQIQELRDELSQRVARRSGPVAIASTPITPNEQVVEPASASARIAELEQSAAEAWRLAEQTQQELLATRAEQSRREAELLQVGDNLRPALQAAQQAVAELRGEREQLRSESEQREQVFEQQTVEWSAEREQWQEELVSLATERQQLLTEWEHRQSTVLDDAARWKSECEQLRAGWQLQQTAWEIERSRMQDETRQHHDAVQQSLQAATQREQEAAERAQQLLLDQQQIEADRQQRQTELLEREQAVAALAEERQHVEQHAVEVLAKLEDYSRRMTEFEQQQANVTREQQTLEHSWNWLHSDRRMLVEEKEDWQQQRSNWQAESEQLQRDREEFEIARDLSREQHAATQQIDVEREQLAAERQHFQAEQSAWVVQLEQFEFDRQTTTDQLEAAHIELQSQQQALSDEECRLQVLRAELEARFGDLEREQPGSMADLAAMIEPPIRDDESSSWNSACLPVVDNDWKSDATTTARTLMSDSLPAEAPLSSLATLTDAWSIGVDLTAPRETHTIDRDVKSEVTSERTPLSLTCPLDEVAATSPAWDAASTSPSLGDAVRTETSDAAAQANDAWEAADRSDSTNNSDPVQPQDFDEAVLRDRLAASEAASEPPDVSMPDAILNNIDRASRVENATIVPTTGPVVSILESMAFADDEDVDDSVSRYMQHLLGRSPQIGAGDRDRYVPETTGKRLAQDAAAVSMPGSEISQDDEQVPFKSVALSEVPTEDAQPGLENSASNDFSLSRPQPVHFQDKVAIRAATEQMRHVANQQTVKNVQAANWKQLKLSIKSKLVLAALAFVLSAGLLYWGYYYRAEFLILGVGASGLGVLTWVDLLVAIRQARARTSRLAGNRKKTGKANS